MGSAKVKMTVELLSMGLPLAVMGDVMPGLSCWRRTAEGLREGCMSALLMLEMCVCVSMS